MIMTTGVFFTSCDPLEDVYADLDQLPSANNRIVGDAKFALSDDDYDDLDLSFGNFSSIDDAKVMIPGLLTSKFPTWGVTYNDVTGKIEKASSATVTFKWYSPKDTYSENIYELSDDDHNDITGNTFGNFDRDYHIFNYLEATYPSPAEDDFHSLRYRFWSNGETTLTDGFYYKDGEWNKIAGFTEAQYNEMGESFPNFSSHDEAEAKTPIALLDVFRFDPKEAGDIVETMYELYKGGGVTKSYTANYIFDGNSWSKYGNVAEETIKFGHDGNSWVPDNTIKYTLTSADIAFISNAFITVPGFEGPADNVGNFGTFDRRSSSSNYWSDDMLLEAFNALLDNLDPSAAEGQKYVLTFGTYIGSVVDENMSVIKTGGVWVLN